MGNFTFKWIGLDWTNHGIGQEVVVAGRIMAIRSFGKLAFVKIRDYTGEVQIFMEKTDQVEDGHFSACRHNGDDNALPYS